MSARQIVGTALIATKGASRKDQDSIDDTIAGLCGAGVYSTSECARHEAEVNG